MCKYDRFLINGVYIVVVLCNRCLAIEPTERATAHSLLCESAFLHSTISSAGGAPTGESTAV